MTVWTVIGIFLLVLLISLAIKAMTRVVAHEERLVIYRLGRFHRVAGPGLVAM
jgi:regulator of protease activity HflC (stomatin/prohibitin superfamily)